MVNRSKILVVPEEIIMSKIYLIRGKKVMLDRDLAELYEVETKQLKRQVRRNRERFPEDFMFELNENEFEEWRSHFGTSKESDKMGLRYAPFVFTEQGVAMLSSVLNSKKAVEVNIQVIRIFMKMREMLVNYDGVLLKLERLERHVLKNTADIQIVFEYIKELIIPPEQKNRKRIGFRKYEEEDSA
jgi:phage regulator Rha-like protein